MQLCCRGDSIRKNLKSLAPLPPLPPLFLTRDLADFTFPQDRDPSKVLLIHGPSGLGKTSLASSLIPTALIVTELEALSDFNPLRHGGIIFDDCPLNRKDREMTLALLDNTKDRSIAGKGKWKMRYKNPKIPMLTPMIWCTNLYPTQFLLPFPEVTRRIEVWKATDKGIFVEDNTCWFITLGERLRKE